MLVAVYLSVSRCYLTGGFYFTAFLFFPSPFRELLPGLLLRAFTNFVFLARFMRVIFRASLFTISAAVLRGRLLPTDIFYHTHLPQFVTQVRARQPIHDPPLSLLS